MVSGRAPTRRVHSRGLPPHRAWCALECSGFLFSAEGLLDALLNVNWSDEMQGYTNSSCKVPDAKEQIAKSNQVLLDEREMALGQLGLSI